MRLKIALVEGFILLIVPIAIFGQKMHLRLDNQISSWGTVNFSEPAKFQLGGRYLPTFSILDSLKKSRTIDAEISVNAYGNIFFSGNDPVETEGTINPYRFWVRYSAPHFELRLGLQKINFGPASIFRPLMWFDRLDIRDPLQLTDGVYGLLARYYFQGNTNIWLWSLYENDKPMGWSAVPTKREIPEFGGRIQQPVPKGEIALTYHHRRADFSTWYDTIPSATQTNYPEDKIGLDGKWDLGVGLWFEYVVKRNDPANVMVKEWETYFNLGLDYTFQLGNGLNITTEYFRYNNTDNLTEKGLKNTLTVLSANYPFGLMNTITAVVYYNWEEDDWSRFVSFQRKYDYWSFYLMAFWNPEYYKPYIITNDRNMFVGKGIQLMTVVNFLESLKRQSSLDGN